MNTGHCASDGDQTCQQQNPMQALDPDQSAFGMGFGTTFKPFV
jgi:hypothetical protein